MASKKEKAASVPRAGKMRRTVEQRNEMVLAQMDLPRRLARRYRERGVELEDLAQDGQVALIGAADDFRREKSPDFRGFAAFVLKRELKEAVRKYYSISARGDFKRRTAEMDSKLAQLRMKLGREPNMHELALALRRKTHRVRWDMQARELGNLVTLEVVQSYVPDKLQTSPEAIAMAREELQRCIEGVRRELAWLAELPPVNRKTFCLRYGLDGSPEPLDLEKVGERRGVSKNAVHQMLGRIWQARERSGQTEERLQMKLARIRAIAEALGEEVRWGLG